MSDHMRNESLIVTGCTCIALFSCRAVRFIQEWRYVAYRPFLVSISTRLLLCSGKIYFAWLSEPFFLFGMESCWNPSRSRNSISLQYQEMLLTLWLHVSPGWLQWFYKSAVWSTKTITMLRLTIHPSSILGVCATGSLWGCANNWISYVDCMFPRTAL